MALSVTVSNDEFPDDHVFEIVGLGAFVNGEATEVDEEAEKRFIVMNQKAVTDAIGEQDAIKVSGNSAVENIDDVLGVDVSDTPAPPDLEAITAAQQEEAAAAEDAGQPGDSATATPNTTVAVEDIGTSSASTGGSDT